MKRLFSRQGAINKLYEEVHHHIADALVGKNESELLRFLEARFRKFDVRNTGYVTQQQFRDILEEIPGLINLTEENFESLVLNSTSDKRGSVEWTPFVVYCVIIELKVRAVAMKLRRAAWQLFKAGNVAGGKQRLESVRITLQRLVPSPVSLVAEQSFHDILRVLNVKLTTSEETRVLRIYSGRAGKRSLGEFLHDHLGLLFGEAPATVSQIESAVVDVEVTDSAKHSSVLQRKGYTQPKTRGAVGPDPSGGGLWMKIASLTPADDYSRAVTSVALSTSSADRQLSRDGYLCAGQMERGVQTTNWQNRYIYVQRDARSSRAVGNIVVVGPAVPGGKVTLSEIPAGFVRAPGKSGPVALCVQYVTIHRPKSSLSCTGRGNTRAAPIAVEERDDEVPLHRDLLEALLEVAEDTKTGLVKGADGALAVDLPLFLAQFFLGSKEKHVGMPSPVSGPINPSTDLRNLPRVPWDTFERKIVDICDLDERELSFLRDALLPVARAPTSQALLNSFKKAPTPARHGSGSGVSLLALAAYLMSGDARFPATSLAVCHSTVQEDSFSKRPEWFKCSGGAPLPSGVVPIPASRSKSIGALTTPSAGRRGVSRTRSVVMSGEQQPPQSRVSVWLQRHEASPTSLMTMTATTSTKPPQGLHPVGARLFSGVQIYAGVANLLWTLPLPSAPAPKSTHAAPITGHFVLQDAALVSEKSDRTAADLQRSGFTPIEQDLLCSGKKKNFFSGSDKLPMVHLWTKKAWWGIGEPGRHAVSSFPRGKSMLRHAPASLVGVSAITEDDPEKFSQALQKLADVMRTVLQEDGGVVDPAGEDFEQQLDDFFDVFDFDGSGEVTLAEFLQLLAENGIDESLSKQDVMRLVAVFDQDQNGLINRDEFCSAMREVFDLVSPLGAGQRRGARRQRQPQQQQRRPARERGGAGRRWGAEEKRRDDDSAADAVTTDISVRGVFDVKIPRGLPVPTSLFYRLVLLPMCRSVSRDCVASALSECSLKAAPSRGSLHTFEWDSRASTQLVIPQRLWLKDDLSSSRAEQPVMLTDILRGPGRVRVEVFDGAVREKMLDLLEERRPASGRAGKQQSSDAAVLESEPLVFRPTAAPVLVSPDGVDVSNALIASSEIRLTSEILDQCLSRGPVPLTVDLFSPAVQSTSSLRDTSVGWMEVALAVSDGAVTGSPTGRPRRAPLAADRYRRGGRKSIPGRRSTAEAAADEMIGELLQISAGGDTERTMEDVRRAFALFDIENAGAIDARQFRAAIKQSFPKVSSLTPKELSSIVDRFDANGDGWIEYSEFTAVLEKYLDASGVQGRNPRRGGRGRVPRPQRRPEPSRSDGDGERSLWSEATEEEEEGAVVRRRRSARKASLKVDFLEVRRAILLALEKERALGRSSGSRRGVDVSSLHAYLKPRSIAGHPNYIKPLCLADALVDLGVTTPEIAGDGDLSFLQPDVNVPSSDDLERLAQSLSRRVKMGRSAVRAVPLQLFCRLVEGVGGAICEDQSLVDKVVECLLRAEGRGMDLAETVAAFCEDSTSGWMPVDDFGNFLRLCGCSLTDVVGVFSGSLSDGLSSQQLDSLVRSSVNRQGGREGLFAAKFVQQLVQQQRAKTGGLLLDGTITGGFGNHTGLANFPPVSPIAKGGLVSPGRLSQASLIAHPPRSPTLLSGVHDRLEETTLHFPGNTTATSEKQLLSRARDVLYSAFNPLALGSATLAVPGLDPESATPEEAVRELLRREDADGTGSVDADRMRDILSQHRAKFSPADWAVLVEKFGLPPDGRRVDYALFCRYVAVPESEMWALALGLADGCRAALCGRIQVRLDELAETEGINALTEFSKPDSRNTGSLSYTEFRGTCHRLGLPLTETSLRILAHRFAAPSSGGNAFGTKQFRVQYQSLLTSVWSAAPVASICSPKRSRFGETALPLSREAPLDSVAKELVMATTSPRAFRTFPFGRPSLTSSGHTIAFGERLSDPTDAVSMLFGGTGDGLPASKSGGRRSRPKRPKVGSVRGACPRAVTSSQHVNALLVDQQDKFVAAKEHFGATGQWDCPVCRFSQTKRAARRCEVCSIPNPYSEDCSVYTQCPTCMFLNAESNAKCVLCGSLLRLAEGIARLHWRDLESRSTTRASPTRPRHRRSFLSDVSVSDEDKDLLSTPRRPHTTRHGM